MNCDDFGLPELQDFEGAKDELVDALIDYFLARWNFMVDHPEGQQGCMFFSSGPVSGWLVCRDFAAHEVRKELEKLVALRVLDEGKARDAYRRIIDAGRAAELFTFQLPA